MSAANGQSSIFIDASQQVTTFRFLNSDGTIDKSYAPIYSGAYQVGYAYELDLGVFFRGGAGMRKAGATMVYDAANYQWDLQYLNTEIGAGYGYPLGRFTPFFQVSGYFGYLLKANQKINNEDFDIIDSGSLKRVDAGVMFIPGVKMSVNELISVYADFSYLMGLLNLETSTNGQKSTNTGYIISLGLSFAIQ
jgi:hypothetical protein